MTRDQIEMERIRNLDVARQWIWRAKLGEFTDGRLMEPGDVSAFVKQGRHLQWNALHLYKHRMSRLKEAA